MRSCKRRSGGFLLVQVLLVLGLIGAFAVLSERIWRLSLQTISKSTTQDDELIRLERALDVLRGDVWHAAKIDAPDSHHLRIVDADANRVDWQSGAAGEVTRTAKGEGQRWAGVGLEFERQGIWVVVRRHGAEIALLRPARGTGGAP